MTPDNEWQRAWREAVRAFRLAATALKNPAPALFADLSVEEGLRDLTQEPPLVSFSPFDALPDGVLTGPYEQSHLPDSGSGRALDPTMGRRTTLAGAGGQRTSGPSRGARDLPVATPPQDNESAVRPPVFTFPQRSLAQRQPSQRNQDVRGDSTKEAENVAHTRRFRTPESTSEDQQQEAPVAVDTLLDLPGALHPGAATGSRDTWPAPEADGYTAGEHGSEDAHRPGRMVKLPEPNRDEAYGNSAIALIDSLAEHLLLPQVRTAGDSSRLGENAPGVAASTVSDVADRPKEPAASDPSPFASLDTVHEELISGLTFGPKPSDTDKEVPGVASNRYTDAEAFASLVNDVLVEQARRHGMDLS